MILGAATFVFLLIGGTVGEGLERGTGEWVILGSNPAVGTLLRNIGNSVYPTLPVSFGVDTKKLLVSSIWCLCQGK